MNFMDDVGQTLLNWASAFGTQEMVEFLCAKGTSTYLTSLQYCGNVPTSRKVGTYHRLYCTVGTGTPSFARVF